MQELTTKTQSGPISLYDVMMNPAMAESINRLAEQLAGGRATVPQHLRGNIPDCTAIIYQCLSWGGINPWSVAQETFLTPTGKLGYQAKLISAVLPAMRAIKGGFSYEPIGDWRPITSKPPTLAKSQNGKDYYRPSYGPQDERGLGVRVTATPTNASAPIDHIVMMNQAYPRFSTLWATNPYLKLCYTATMQWARLYAPGAMQGILSDDEPPQGELDISDQVELVSEVPEKPTGPSMKIKEEVSLGDARGSHGETIVAKRPQIETADQDPPGHKTEEPPPFDLEAEPKKTPVPTQPNGVPFNPSIHAADEDGAPKKNQDGTFRVKRFKAEAAKEWEKKHAVKEEDLGDSYKKPDQEESGPRIDGILDGLKAASSVESYRALEMEARNIWPLVDMAARKKLMAAIDDAKTRLGLDAQSLAKKAEKEEKKAAPTSQDSAGLEGVTYDDIIDEMKNIDTDKALRELNTLAGSLWHKFTPQQQANLDRRFEQLARIIELKQQFGSGNGGDTETSAESTSLES